MKTAACSSCGAPILWAITHTGARMPLDPTPVELLDAPARGSFMLVKRIDDTPLAISAQPDGPALTTLAGRQVALYVSHFPTCPQADQHRRSAA